MNKRSIVFMVAASVVLILILAIIVALISSPSSRERKPTMEYNHFPFYEEQGLWKTTLQRGPQTFELMLRYNPEQVEDITYGGDLVPGFVENQPIYITFDPDAPEQEMKYLALSAAEVGLSLVRGFGLTIEAACTKNLTEACFNRTILTCEDNRSIVYLKVANETGVFFQGSCITIQGKEWEIIKAVDRMLYEWYGIINPNSELDTVIAQYKADVDLYLQQTNG
jgi:hypothetical protein